MERRRSARRRSTTRSVLYLFLSPVTAIVRVIKPDAEGIGVQSGEQVLEDGGLLRTSHPLRRQAGEHNSAEISMIN